jgi:hypothetical protein
LYGIFGVVSVNVFARQLIYPLLYLFACHKDTNWQS